MIIKYRRQLPDLMRFLKLPMTAVEIGVAEGYFSADLLRERIEKLYMVDVWSHVPNVKGDSNSPKVWHDKNYEAAITRVTPWIYSDNATVLKGLSKDMAKHVPDDSLGLVYLDADHSYEGVMADLKNWFPKLVKGGIMAGHDYLMFEYGIFKAVHDFVEKIGRANDYKIMTIPEYKEEDAGFYFIKT